jgi:hypothetical protein
VKRVLLAETAILVHFQPIGVVFLVFHGVVVALLAIGAGKGNLDSHIRLLLLILPPSGTRLPFRAKAQN